MTNLGASWPREKFGVSLTSVFPPSSPASTVMVYVSSPLREQTPPGQSVGGRTSYALSTVILLEYRHSKRIESSAKLNYFIFFLCIQKLFFFYLIDAESLIANPVEVVASE